MRINVSEVVNIKSVNSAISHIDQESSNNKNYLSLNFDKAEPKRIDKSVSKNTDKLEGPVTIS